MEMILVMNSSNVKAYGWKENVILFNGCIPRNILRIEFLNGMIYDYIGISDEVFKNFLKSESKGSFLHRNIIGKYQTISVV